MAVHSSKVRDTVLEVNTRFLMVSRTIMDYILSFYPYSKRLRGR
jgi:hypothetical protein